MPVNVRQHVGRSTSAYCWLPEYSGPDATWKVYRTTFVYRKRRVVPR